MRAVTINCELIWPGLSYLLIKMISGRQLQRNELTLTVVLNFLFGDCSTLLQNQSPYVTQTEKTSLIAYVSRFDFLPRTQSYMNKLSNSTIKIS